MIGNGGGAGGRWPNSGRAGHQAWHRANQRTGRTGRRIERSSATNQIKSASMILSATPSCSSWASTPAARARSASSPMRGGRIVAEARGPGAQPAVGRRARRRKGPASGHRRRRWASCPRVPRPSASEWRASIGRATPKIVRGILVRIGHRARVLVVNDALIALEAGLPDAPGIVHHRRHRVDRLRPQRRGAGGARRRLGLRAGRRGQRVLAGPAGAARRRARRRRTRARHGAHRAHPRALPRHPAARSSSARSTTAARVRARSRRSRGTCRPLPRTAIRSRSTSSTPARRSWRPRPSRSRASCGVEAPAVILVGRHAARRRPPPGRRDDAARPATARRRSSSCSTSSRRSAPCVWRRRSPRARVRARVRRGAALTDARRRHPVRRARPSRPSPAYRRRRVRRQPEPGPRPADRTDADAGLRRARRSPRPRPRSTSRA